MIPLHTFFGLLSYALLTFVPLILAFRTYQLFYPSRFRAGFLSISLYLAVSRISLVHLQGLEPGTH